MNQTENEHDGSHDFDFFFGHWTVHNRKLRTFVQGGDDWETFEALANVQPILGGKGNIDDFVAETWRPGFIGMTMRLFDPTTKKWSLYWLDNRAVVLQPPVVGAFENGVGVFEGREEFDGKTIRVRYTWSNITRDTAQWKQAFSWDDGKIWEINWTMEMRRIGDREDGHRKDIE